MRKNRRSTACKAPAALRLSSHTLNFYCYIVLLCLFTVVVLDTCSNNALRYSNKNRYIIDLSIKFYVTALHVKNAQKSSQNAFNSPQPAKLAPLSKRRSTAAMDMVMMKPHCKVRCSGKDLQKKGHNIEWRELQVLFRNLHPPCKYDRESTSIPGECNKDLSYQTTNDSTSNSHHQHMVSNETAHPDVPCSCSRSLNLEHLLRWKPSSKPETKLNATSKGCNREVYTSIAIAHRKRSTSLTSPRIVTKENVTKGRALLPTPMQPTHRVRRPACSCRCTNSNSESNNIELEQECCKKVATEELDPPQGLQLDRPDWDVNTSCSTEGERWRSRSAPSMLLQVSLVNPKLCWLSNRCTTMQNLQRTAPFIDKPEREELLYKKSS